MVHIIYTYVDDTLRSAVQRKDHFNNLYQCYLQFHLPPPPEHNFFDSEIVTSINTSSEDLFTLEARKGVKETDAYLAASVVSSVKKHIHVAVLVTRGFAVKI